MSESDMLRRQQDAVNMAREMHRRAKASVNSAVGQNHNDKRTKPKPMGFSYKEDENEEEKEKPKNDVPQKKRGFDILKLFNFKNLGGDSDRSLILLILILLSGEDCDELLLLALVYLLL